MTASLNSVASSTSTVAVDNMFAQLGVKAGATLTPAQMAAIAAPVKGVGLKANQKAARAPSKVIVTLQPSAVIAPAAAPAKALAKAKAPKASAPVKVPAIKVVAPTAAPVAPKAPATAKAPRAADLVMYRIATVEKAQKGIMLAFMSVAHALASQQGGTFNRAQVEAEFGGRSGSAEAQILGTYFPYCVKRGDFTVA